MAQVVFPRNISECFQEVNNVRIFADVLIEHSSGGLVIIDRGVPPYGWAFPGGIVDQGEDSKEAAIREALEETDLKIEIQSFFHCYPFVNTGGQRVAITMVYLGKADGAPVAGDDAKRVMVRPLVKVPVLIHPHQVILADYRDWLRTGKISNPNRTLTSDYPYFEEKKAA